MAAPADTGTPPATDPWDPNAFAQIVGRPPTQAETAFYSTVPTWRADVMNAAGGGAPTTPGQAGTGYKGPALPRVQLPGTPPPTTPPPAATPAAGSYDALMSALQQNYSALGATPSGPGSGPTDISYFARRIQETGGMTPQNMSYWFGPTGRIAQELKGSVPPETAAASTPANAPPGTPATQGPYLPGSLGQGLTTQFWWS